MIRESRQVGLRLQIAGSKATALSNKLQTKYAHVFVSRQKVAQSGHPADRPFESNGIQVEQRAIGTLQ